MDPITLPPRNDVVSVTSETRPTPKTGGARFSEVLANGAVGVAQGAEMAMSQLPGGPIVAAALRGGMGPSTALSSPLNLPTLGAAGLGTGAGSSLGGATSAAEGPNAIGVMSNLGLGSGSDGGVASSLAQSQQSNLYYLQIQQEVNQQSQTFETLSNVLKSESDTIKNAISNLH